METENVDKRLRGVNAVQDALIVGHEQNQDLFRIIAR